MYKNALIAALVFTVISIMSSPATNNAASVSRTVAKKVLAVETPEVSRPYHWEIFQALERFT